MKYHKDGFHNGIYFLFKGTQIDPLLVLVSPCFRENVKVTCKNVSFLCCLDHFF